MRKLLIFCFALTSALFMSSCGGDDDEGANDAPAYVVWAPGTPGNEVIYADQTQNAAKGLRFTAKDSWTAAVNEVPMNRANGNCTWLRLSAYQGEAGQVNLTVSIDENLTGKDRKAEIVISCGGMTFKVTIEQKGKTQEEELHPQTMKYISKLECKYYDKGMEVKDDIKVCTYTYDNQNRIIKAVESETFLEKNHPFELAYTNDITYREGEILEETTHLSNGQKYYTERVINKLNAEGYIISCESDYQNNSSSGIRYKYELTYDEGVFKRGSYCESNDGEWYDPDYIDMYWENGQFSKVNVAYEPGEVFYNQILGWSKVPNKTNFDLNAMLVLPGSFVDFCDNMHTYHRLSYVGKPFGKTMLNYYTDWDETDVPPFQMVSIPRKFEYDTDADGYITEIRELTRDYRDSFEYLRITYK